MEMTQPSAALSEHALPTSESERLVGLDVLRGFALYGVLLTNASVWARPITVALSPPNRDTTESARAVSGLLDMLAWGILDGLLVTKFVALFSLLFGMGLILQFQRAEAKGLPFTQIYRRRLIILAGLGLIHGCLLFEGDILFVYAAVGALLFFFRNQSPRVLLWLSLIPFLAGVLISILWAGLDLEALGATSELDSALSESPRANSLQEIPFTRPIEFLGWLVISSLISFNLRVVAFFFLGAAIMKSGWILPSCLRVQRMVAFIGMGVGVSIELLGLYFATFTQPVVLVRVANALCDEIGSIVLSLGYAGGVLWIVHTGHLQWLSQGLAAVGRTALTNYLLQSVVMNIVFMEFLLGYYNRMPRFDVLIVFSCVFALQTVVSLAWLRCFKMGPVEWLWRTLTYHGIGEREAKNEDNKIGSQRPMKISFVLVGLQVCLSAGLVVFARPSYAYASGLIVAFIGVPIGVWAIVTMGVRRVKVMPEPSSDAELVTSGPYRFVRHPMYTALLLFTGGLVFCPFAIWKGLAWCLLAAVLLAKLTIEEKHLRASFPGYEDYSRRTKRLLPWVF